MTVLYQVHPRTWLTELTETLGRPVTLDDIPDADLDQFAENGFDWVWFLSLWSTSAASQRLSCSRTEWHKEFKLILPDLTERDIAGSGFAIAGYDVPTHLGGNEALRRLRARLHKRGLRLMLDFIPNHTAVDHPWVQEHPDYYVQGTRSAMARAPGNYARIKGPDRVRYFAHGRDPYFPPWVDTLQLNYGNPATQDAVVRELLQVAARCDGVRCDMAMLVLPEVFERTWGIAARPFWPDAIRRVRELFPRFCFLAEVYWDLEQTLLQQGFDYAYDKRLYDQLRDRNVAAIREHLQQPLVSQGKLAHFLENHDEPRAAAMFPPAQHQAAAAITFLSPGLRFFQQGQLEGRRKRTSAHLCRAAFENTDPGLQKFYRNLLDLLREPNLRQAQWQWLEVTPPWEGNRSCDALITFWWQNGSAHRLLTVVNYADHPSQGYVQMPIADLKERTWRLIDRLGNEHYHRNGNELAEKGLYLDMPAWKAHLFEIL